jgi:hypothetical protein
VFINQALKFRTKQVAFIPLQETGIGNGEFKSATTIARGFEFGYIHIIAQGYGKRGIVEFY